MLTDLKHSSQSVCLPTHHYIPAYKSWSVSSNLFFFILFILSNTLYGLTTINSVIQLEAFYLNVQLQLCDHLRWEWTMTYRAVALLLVCAPTWMTCDCPLLVTGRSASQMSESCECILFDPGCAEMQLNKKKTITREKSLGAHYWNCFYQTPSGHFSSYTRTMESTVIWPCCMINSDDTATGVLNEIYILLLLWLRYVQGFLWYVSSLMVYIERTTHLKHLSVRYCNMTPLTTNSVPTDIQLASHI